jgi:dephospho-CoA kinase
LKIIGAVGQIGSGKDTVIRYIANRLLIPTISIGDIAREIARNEGLPATRENLQKITQKRYEQFGNVYFIEETIRKIKHANIDRILITGIRAPTDIAALRKNFHDNFLLICVTANKKTRFQRLAKRATNIFNITGDYTFRLIYSALRGVPREQNIIVRFNVSNASQ